MAADEITIRIRGAVPLTIECPKCKASVTVPRPEVRSTIMNICRVTCVCGQQLVILVRG